MPPPHLSLFLLVPTCGQLSNATAPHCLYRFKDVLVPLCHPVSYKQTPIVLASMTSLVRAQVMYLQNRVIEREHPAAMIQLTRDIYFFETWSFFP